MADFVSGAVTALGKRKISEETCRKWGYRVGDYNGQTVHIADYWNPEGTEVVAQKVRFPNKDFTITGKMKEAGLYGQHLWRDKGKMIVVTEGEIDALTVSQLQDNRWPVVSIPHGAKGAKKALSKHLEWLLGFDTIILFFDADEEGRRAVEECAPLFPPGRCKVARMADFKDPSDAHQAGKSAQIIDAIWGAKVYRPDGVLSGSELWDALTTDDELVETATYPWDGVNTITHGLRRAELVTITAGSGVGKSAVVREIAHHLLREGETVGMLMLEESVKRTARGLMGIALNRPVHLDMTPWAELPEEERQARRQAYEAVIGNDRLYLYDHFGSTEVDNLLNRVRYLAKGCECGWIILDHLSIVVSGLDDGDERKAIDVAMTKLRTLVQETGVGLIMVSHLRRPSGDRGHEQGAETSLSQLRGSHSIAQLSDMVIGLERDQQDEKTKDITTVRILKNRFSGETGIATHLLYSKDTGRLTECRPEFVAREEEDDDPPF
ncbi:DnaB-like helicase C-terminal domain-containing protein [Azorhizobium caulinodans]|nr:DnaB-like helicase C-terminal domain-containing protein [Azorhizobium caulinodans]